MKTFLFLVSLWLASDSIFAQDYAPQVTISRPVSAGLSEQKATQTILASNVISQYATAHYTAGQSVDLQPGFMAQAGSVFRATIAPVVSVRSVEEVPALSVRAYPNPFVDQTTIEYHLPLGGRIQHTLLDATGQILRQFDEVTKPSDGLLRKQVTGDGLPTGTYLYQVKSGNETHTLRLLKK